MVHEITMDHEQRKRKESLAINVAWLKKKGNVERFCKAISLITDYPGVDPLISLKTLGRIEIFNDFSWNVTNENEEEVFVGDNLEEFVSDIEENYIGLGWTRTLSPWGDKENENGK